MPDLEQGSADAGAIDFVNPFGNGPTAPEAAAEPDEAPGVPAASQPDDEGADPNQGDWRTQRYPEAEGAHGFYKGRTLGEVDDGLRKLEGLKSEAERRANEAEARAAAAETLIQALTAKVQQTNQSTAQAPAPEPEDPFAARGIDLSTDWVVDPQKVVPVLEDRIVGKALSQLRQEQEQREAKAREEQEHQRLVEDFERSAAVAAWTALNDMKIPENLHNAVLDVMVPVLTNPHGEYAMRGGVLDPSLYKEAIHSNPVLRSAISSIVASEVGGSSAVSQPNPPGVKSVGAVQRQVPQASHNLNQATRDMVTNMARNTGITDPAEIEAMLEETAQRLAAAKARRKKDRG
jgi:hypothetical protein